MKRALVFWFTGLSGSGKTTIAEQVLKRFGASKKVKVFDGDEIRRGLNKHLGFSPEHISENNRIIADLCLKNIDKYDYILVPIIAPFDDARRAARKAVGDDFYLVYVKASLDEVIRRDPKGLYKRALSGSMEKFVGVDKTVPYEVPEDADLVLDTESTALPVLTEKFAEFIINKEKDVRNSRL